MPSRYDAKHVAERRRWEPIVATGGVACVLCGHPIIDGKIRAGTRLVSSWHLDHLPGTDRYRGPAHVRCNTRDGAIRGNRQRGRRRAAVIRSWGAW